MILLILLTALSLVAIVASVVVVRRDGYRHIPAVRGNRYAETA